MIRLVYISTIPFLGLIGVFSRKLLFVPSFIAANLGDAVWAMALYFLLRSLFPQKKTWFTFSLACIISLLTELSQLYHAQWIDDLRQCLPVRLIIGNSFRKWDLLCYLSGIIIAFLIDIPFRKRFR